MGVEDGDSLQKSFDLLETIPRYMSTYHLFVMHDGAVNENKVRIDSVKQGQAVPGLRTNRTVTFLSFDAHNYVQFNG
jgi:hypothetical protein